MLPSAKIHDLARHVVARDAKDPNDKGLNRLQFVELLGHIAIRAMPGDTAKSRLLELLAWLHKSNGRRLLRHPHNATFRFVFH